VENPYKRKKKHKKKYNFFLLINGNSINMSERAARSKIDSKVCNICVLSLGSIGRVYQSSYSLLPQCCGFVRSIGFAQFCVWDAHISQVAYFSYKRVQ